MGTFRSFVIPCCAAGLFAAGAWGQDAAREARTPEHAMRMREALDEHHVTYQWLELPGEGHAFVKGDNWMRFYKTVEQFPLKYNPPD
jgi:hypothetical protein